MYSLIDTLCIISGGYLIYTAMVMKKQGRIINNVVLNKGADESAIHDKDGFIRFLYSKLILFGSLIILAGIVNLVNDYMSGPGIVTTITCCIFAAAIIGYGVVTNIALKRYVKKDAR